jgi:hypothetical protein
MAQAASVLNLSEGEMSCFKSGAFYATDSLFQQAGGRSVAGIITWSWPRKEFRLVHNSLDQQIKK